MNGPFPPSLRYVVELNEFARPESRGGEATLGRTILAPMNSAEGAVRYRRRRRRSMKANDIKARTTRPPTDPPAIAPTELAERVDLLDDVGDTAAVVTAEKGEEVVEVLEARAVITDEDTVTGTVETEELAETKGSVEGDTGVKLAEGLVEEAAVRLVVDTTKVV